MKETNSTAACTHPGYVSKKLYDALNEQLDEVMSGREEEAARFRGQLRDSEEEAQSFRERLNESETVVRKLQSDINKMKEASEKVNAAFVVFQGCLREFNEKGRDHDLQDQAAVPQTRAASEAERSPKRQIQSRQVGSVEAELNDFPGEVEKNKSSSRPVLTQDRPATIASPTQKPQDPADRVSSLTTVADSFTVSGTPIFLPRPASSSMAIHQDTSPLLSAEELEEENRPITAVGISRAKGDQTIAQNKKANQESRKHGDEPGIATKRSVMVVPSRQEQLAKAILSATAPLQLEPDLAKEARLKAAYLAGLAARDAKLAKRKREVGLAAETEVSESLHKKKRLRDSIDTGPDRGAGKKAEEGQGKKNEEAKTKPVEEGAQTRTRYLNKVSPNSRLWL